MSSIFEALGHLFRAFSMGTSRRFLVPKINDASKGISSALSHYPLFEDTGETPFWPRKVGQKLNSVDSKYSSLFRSVARTRYQNPRNHNCFIFRCPIGFRVARKLVNDPLISPHIPKAWRRMQLGNQLSDKRNTQQTVCILGHFNH